MTDEIDYNEFVDEGYLLAINREFLHPLGLAMFVRLDDGMAIGVGIYDGRDDPEGYIFCPAHSMAEAERRDIKMKRITEISNRWAIQRIERLGFLVQPKFDITVWTDGEY